MSLGASATLALPPEVLRALQQSGGKLVQRAIPSSGERLPVVGLHFGNPPPPDHAALKAVLKTLLDSGGRFLDTVHQSAAAEEVTATIATELGVQDTIFWSSRASPAGPPQPGAAAAKALMERSLVRFKVPKLDLVQMNPMADPGHLAALKEMKQEGRVRYIGMQVIDDRQYAGLEAVMRKEPIDFIGIDYSIGNRGVEQTILPLAQERKIGVVAYFPFDAGGLFQRVGTTPLPGWAADFDARTWAQFFLKYVISHPAVTVVRTGTSQAKHMLENIGGGTGRLPNQATRKRMAELVDSWPLAGTPGPSAPQGAAVVVPAAILDRYAGEYKTASGSVTVRRSGSALHVKSGHTQEAPLVARSETRFSDPWGAIIEFQLDAAGTVTGFIMQEGQLKLQGSRIR
ncbi:MAG TPA: aldo/keto reductase [Vicinamibacterales bacterium]|nr:aldo/keto reductase [Vicinamibacterales bacterium]